MANDGDVRIRITAQSDVKGGAAEAERDLTGFAGRAKTISGGAAAAIGGIAGGVATMALSLVKDAGAAVYGFFKDSINEAGAAERSTNALQHALGNLGLSYKDLEAPIDKVISGLARQTKFTDDDLRDALTGMIQITGDAEGSLKNMAVVADLAAARNLDLGAASDIVAKAMAGNTTALTKLFPELKGSADAVGALGEKLKGTAEDQAAGFQGRLENVFKQLGEVKEAIGGVVTGGEGLNNFLGGAGTLLESLAGWIGRNAEKFRDFFAAIGEVGSAIFDTGKAIVQTMQPALAAIGGGNGSLFARLLGLIGEVAAGFRAFSGAALSAVGLVQAKLGEFVMAGGRVLKLFGIDVGVAWGKTLKDAGEIAVAEGGKLLEESRAQHEKAWTQLRTGVRQTEEAQTETVKKETSARTRLVKESNKEIEASHLETTIAREKAARESAALFQKVEEALRKIDLAQHKEQWAEIDRNVRLVKGDLSDLLPPAEELKASIDENNKALEKNRETAKDVKGEFQQTVEGAVGLGRALLDVAQASGAVNSEMASVMNSVLNIGSSLARIGVDPLGGIVGVLGGLANVITGIGNSEAHRAMKAALSQNKDALDRLSREVGNLDLSATGKQFKGIQSAIAATEQAQSSGQLKGRDRVETDIKTFDFFIRELLKNGVSLSEAKQILGDLGFGGAFTSAATFGASLGQIGKGLGDVEFGQFGQDFESQLRSITEGFGVFGVEDKGQQLAQLSQLGSFSPAIAAALQSGDAGGALRGLFGKLQTGGLSAEDFGDLNGGQFLDLLKLLIPLADAVGGTGAMLPADFGTLGLGKDDKLVTGGLDSMDSETGTWFPGSGGSLGSGGVAGIVVNGGWHFGPVTVAPDGRSVEEVGEELTEKISQKLFRRIADQSAAQGVPL